MKKKDDNKQQCNRTRPPMVKKSPTPTPPPPPISYGKNEKTVMGYIKNHPGRINIHELSRTLNVPKSTIYDLLERMRKKGLIDYDYPSFSKLTDLGLSLMGVGFDHTVSRTVPDQESRSYIRDHKLTFEIPIKEFPKGWDSNSVAFLSHNEIQTKIWKFSKNNPLIQGNFPENVDVIFTTTKIILKTKEIMADDHTSATSKAIIKAYQTIEYLIKLGFNFQDQNGILKLIQKDGHYTETNSILAEFFDKHAKGFNIKDRGGKTLFWIDHSDGNREDETATETARERLDKHLFDVMDHDLPKLSELSQDLESLKQITADLVKIQFLTMKTNQLQNEVNKINEDNERIKPNYFG